MPSNIKYLNDYSKTDIPTKTPKDPIIYKQKVHNEEYYKTAFGDDKSIEQVWDTIHVFTYESMKANREVLLLGPIVLEFSPRKILGFNLNKTAVKTNLEGFVELSETELKQEQIEDAKKALLEQVISGDMPWENNHINAIYTQNNINHALNLVGAMLPDINGDNIKAITLREAFNRVYQAE